MTSSLKEPSEIRQYFSGTTVFVTGGTGFLGKLLVEKLLRTCTDIVRIYILIREKKGKNGEKRYQEILENALYDQLKREQPNFAQKITLINGDCLLPKLGLAKEDEERLMNEVNCVFHGAATVRFDEKLRTAAYINVRATKDMLVLSKQMKKLKSFVYVSTVYSNCVYKEIKEEFYEPPITGDRLLDFVDMFNDDVLEKMKPTLIGEWPNTYSFSKAVAEGIVESYCQDLPIAVVRPSAVISTANEPLQGWIDNIYGPAGVVLGAGVGLIHTARCTLDYFAEIVPADLVTNCTIAAAWDAGTKRDANNKDDGSVYNYVSSVQKPLIWRDFLMYIKKYGKQTPSVLMLWYPFLIVNSTDFMQALCVLLLHTIPAYIADFFALCLGKKQMLVKGYQKINKFLHVLAYFSTTKWVYRNENTQALWRKLNTEDREAFNFDMYSLDWDCYFKTFIKGGRVYLMKDPLETVPQGRTKYFRLKVMHYILVSLLLVGLYKLVMIVFKAVF